MAFNMEKAAAQRLLGALEDGRLGATDTFHLVEEADPTLVYFVFAWLRAWYPSSHSASDGVLGRIGELCSRYPKAARMAQDGKDDPRGELGFGRRKKERDYSMAFGAFFRRGWFLVVLV